MLPMWSAGTGTGFRGWIFTVRFGFPYILVRTASWNPHHLLRSAERASVKSQKILSGMGASFFVSASSLARARCSSCSVLAGFVLGAHNRAGLSAPSSPRATNEGVHVGSHRCRGEHNAQKQHHADGYANAQLVGGRVRKPQNCRPHESGCEEDRRKQRGERRAPAGIALHEHPQQDNRRDGQQSGSDGVLHGNPFSMTPGANKYYRTYLQKKQG